MDFQWQQTLLYRASSLTRHIGVFSLLFTDDNDSRETIGRPSSAADTSITDEE